MHAVARLVRLGSIKDSEAYDDDQDRVSAARAHPHRHNKHDKTGLSSVPSVSSAMDAQHHGAGSTAEKMRLDQVGMVVFYMMNAF